MEMIIGKEGNQPFEIKNECVSRQHAKISISDDGRWMLEDLDSTNGTYIQDEKGLFVRVKHAEINEFTRIALGSTTATGYYFFAHHILEKNGNYEREMRYVLEQYGIICSNRERVENKNSRTAIAMRFVPCLIPLIVTGVIMMFFPEQTKLFVLGSSATGLLSTVAALFQQNCSSKLKFYTDLQSRIVRCPKCNRQLTASDIQSEQCANCRTHS